MNFWQALQNTRQPNQLYDPPADVNPYILEMMLAINAQPLVYKEREALKVVDAAWTKLKAASVEERTAFVFESLPYFRDEKTLTMRMAVKAMVAALLRGGLPLTSMDALRLVENVSEKRLSFPYKALLSALENITMTPALRDALLALRPMIDHWHGGTEMNEIHNRIDELLNGSQEKPVAAVSGWSRHVLHEIDASPKQMAWRAILLHGRSLTQSNASRKWMIEAVALVDRVGREEFLDAARRWLALGPMPEMATHLQVPDEEADYQKGFIWTLGALGDTSVASDIADFAFACFRKIPQIGAVSHRVGNACVNALAAMPGLNAVTQISRLSMRVKYDVARRLIEKALAEAAERNNVSRDDLEAMSVPTYGLNEDGLRVEVLGDCEARLAIENGDAVLSWSRHGKLVKSIPAEVKTDHAEAVANLKKSAKELQGVLSTQRLRLERTLLSQSTCPFENWKAWYIDHPITSIFSKRLIWEIDSQTAIWRDGSFVDWTGKPITIAPEAKVRLWHPIRASVQEVINWRCRLEDDGIRQPFKQAHREIYILTDAERQTETYSNRFASHVVRQHQFSALCRERGWQFNLMGEWDSHNNPYLELPQYNLRVEFHVDFFDESEVSGHMIYKTIRTDRVQFFPIEPKPKRFEFRPRTAVRLAGIDPLIFSEAMRDVDLLVGVTSIGTDPNWGVQAGDPHAEYWLRFADADLSGAAENRKCVLETLLPKLAIRDRSRLEGRYLIVRGESNEYKIHIGSGNVLMEPGTRYLCIVQGAGDSAANVSLPFDGDSMLAIILSKAFLLANDKSIKDPTILRQIRGGD